MKQFFSQFFLRGLLAAAGGPMVLAIVYGILGASGAVSTLSPREVCLGILSITFLAFVVGGMTAIYQMEQLPLASAILIHCGTLYGTYLLIYLLNGWLPNRLVPFLVFTGVFLVTYSLIWLFIYIFNRRRIRRINQKLPKQ